MTTVLNLPPASEHRGFALISEQASGLRAFAANPRQRIKTGLRSLDLVVGGPAWGEVFMVLGRSYTGKSLIATQIMANNPETPIVFFSLEMPAHQCIQRMYAQATDTPSKTVASWVSSNKIPPSYEEAFSPYAKHVIVDKGGMTLGDMTAYLEEYEDWFGHRPEAVIVDYLEEIGGGKASGEGWVRTEATASALKTWAKQEQVAVFVLHQANKAEAAWDPPTEDSAKGGGFTEADAVIGIWRPGRDPRLSDGERRRMEPEIHMNVLKNRVSGRTWHDMRYVVTDSLRLVDMDVRRVEAFFAGAPY